MRNDHSTRQIGATLEASVTTDIIDRQYIKIERGEFERLRALDERVKAAPVVYLIEVDRGTDNACWRVCAKGDPCSEAFSPI